MKITIFTEARFIRMPDGTVWSEDGLRQEFWHRYLNVFDCVEVVARVLLKTAVSTVARRVDAENIVFRDLPYYIGPVNFLRSAYAINKKILKAVSDADAVILRAPGNISGLAVRHLRAQSRPFGVEVVGDPSDVFSPGTIEHPLRRYFRWLETTRLKQICAAASGAAYVTSEMLQRRYPNGRFSTDYSSIDLPDEYFSVAPKDYSGPPERFELVFIGSLSQMYKGADILLRAIAICCVAGIKIRLTLIGEGKYRPGLENLAADLGVESAVVFSGQLDNKKVQETLRKSDLFVLPSRTEGLPRAMIEAMACALPCIGTAVGGVPELLPTQDLVEANNAEALASKITEVLFDCARMAEMSAQNLRRALHFRRSVLDGRRHQFYSYIRDCTMARDSAWRKVA